MKVSIFSRLIAGYLAIVLLVTTVSAYVIFQLHRFGTVTSQILDINRTKEYEDKLADLLLSQVRYERKYVIVRDKALYDQFLQAKKDFIEYLDKLAAADSSRKNEIVNGIRDRFGHYQSLVNEEAEFIQKNKMYPQNRYATEKEQAVNGIVGELKKLGVHSQQDTFDRIRILGEAEAATLKIVIAMTGITLLMVVVISFVITRSITKPVSLLVDMTRQVSEGVFKCELALTSPPELARLTNAFSYMCDKLEALDKLKSNFFSAMSHELRTPLTSIKEGTNLLVEGVGGAVTEKQRKLLDIIAEESNRLIGIVDSLLDLSKMEAGMMTFHFSKEDILPLIQKAIAGLEPLAISKNVDVALQTAPELPRVKMDSMRILQVLQNLIGNAIKFTPSGGQVKVSAAQMNGAVQVSVTDTGKGIPKENLTTVFEKFQQVPVTDSCLQKGTGLGLTIARQIITAHGGKIWAESEIGKGSIFSFLLPV